jgi:hypothetical protein
VLRDFAVPALLPAFLFSITRSGRRHTHPAALIIFRDIGGLSIARREFIASLGGGALDGRLRRVLKEPPECPRSPY